MNNRFTNRTPPGISMRLAVVICVCASGNQAKTKRSMHKGVTYTNPRVYNIEYSFEMFPDPNKTNLSKDLELWVPIPREWDSQKAVKIISVQPKPHGRYVDPEHGNPMLFWDFSQEPERPSYEVNLKYRVEQYDVHSDIDPNRIGPYNKTSRDYVLYTRSTKAISITDKVQQLAKGAMGTEKNPYRQAQRIYELVRDKMRYGSPRGLGTMRSVETILDRPIIDPKTGQAYYLGLCHDQGMVFVALCRAVGIPARNVLALWDNRPWIRTTPENHESTVDIRERSIQGLAISAKAAPLAGHSWAEIFLPNYGWILVDPTFGRMGHSNVNNRIIVITKGRDIQIDPHAVQKGNGRYREIGGPLCNGRAGLLMGGVFHGPTIKRVEYGYLHHPDPFPADALAEYITNIHREIETKDYLALYRKRALRWIDQNTREHTDKTKALAKAYKERPQARYEHEVLVCHMLQKIMGDKRFSNIVQTYTDLRVKSGQSVSTARFQNIAERIYGQPLGWFFKQWVGYTELPQLQLSAVTISEEENGWCVRGILRQLNKSLFRLPVELVIETEKTNEHKMLWMEDKDTDFELRTANRPTIVLVDPDYDILQIREMPPLLESPSHDEVAFCAITDLQRADLYHWTPLHFAAQAGQMDVVECLISNGADVNAENIEGETPLQFAAAESHIEIVELLRTHGAKE